MVARAKTTKKAKKGAAAGKAKKKSVARTAKSSGAAASATKVIDVRKPADISKFMNTLKSNKIVLVLVYADWCGHCKTFKDDIWNKLKSLPNRKVALAEVNADMVAKTPAISSAKIDGYPSVVPIGNDMKPASFKGENGESTNAMPNTRDSRMMESLVTSDPEKVLSSGSATPPSPPISTEPESTEKGEEEEGEGESKTLRPEAEASRKAAAEASAEVTRPSKEELSRAEAPIPPNINDDLLSSQGMSDQPASGTRPRSNEVKERYQDGGSLYQDLKRFVDGMPALGAHAKGRRSTRRAGDGTKRRTTRRQGSN